MCVYIHTRARTYIFDSMIMVITPKTSVLSEHFPACREGFDERNTDAAALL